MKLSFVVPSFNCVTWLPHAVASCLDQTYKDIEVVIVDDGSTDRTGEYLESLKNDSRVHVCINVKNAGRSEARNLGNRIAQGDIICVLDADDIATPNRAEITVKKFRASKVDFLYGAATVIDCLGRPMQDIRPDVFDKTKALEAMQNGIVHSTVAYTKAFAARYPYHGGDIATFGIDDWSQQISAKLDGAIFDFVPQRLACYRILQTAISKTRDESKVLEAKKQFLTGLKVPA